ncbi:unnamed protein product [Caenorhabditis nigoni]
MDIFLFPRFARLVLNSKIDKKRVIIEYGGTNTGCQVSSRPDQRILIDGSHFLNIFAENDLKVILTLQKSLLDYLNVHVDHKGQKNRQMDKMFSHFIPFFVDLLKSRHRALTLTTNFKWNPNS